MTPVANPNVSALRDLQEIHHDPTLKGDIQQAFLGWLEAPEHQPRQMRGYLFGRGGKCCALGGLAHVLADLGFAALDAGTSEVVFKHRGERLFRWPSTLPDEVGAALDWELGWISNLNDEGHQTFAQIAQTIRDTQRNEQTLPF